MTQTVPSPTLPSVESYSLPSNSLAGSQEFRLDAAHYNPELLKAISVLRTSGMRVERLADITDKLFIPPRFKRIYVDNPAHGVPFLQGSHIVQFQPTDIKHLSKSCHRLERWMVSAEWLLVTCSGTIGRTVMCPQEWDGWAASQHILRIVPDKKKCPPGYLCAFLASPFGQVQLTANIYGAVVDELTEEQAKGILVPIPETAEDKVLVRSLDATMRESVAKRSEAASLVDKAVDSLPDGSLQATSKLDLFFIRTRHMGEELRMDAGHYNPAVLHALDKLGSMGAVPLREVAEVFMPPRFRRVYVEPEHGLPFLQGSHVTHFQAAGLQCLLRKHEHINEVIVRSGWLLVTRSGTVGRVTICPQEWDGWAATEDIIRVVPDESRCPGGYLFSFLASALGQVQLTSQVHGAVVDHLTEDHVRSVLVPLGDADTIERIDSIMRKGVDTKSRAVAATEASVQGIAKRFGTQSPRVSKERSVHPEPKSSPTRDEHFEKIEATPEELAKVFLRTPPKKPEEWDYIKDTRSDD